LVEVRFEIVVAPRLVRPITARLVEVELPEIKLVILPLVIVELEIVVLPRLVVPVIARLVPVAEVNEVRLRTVRPLMLRLVEV
jgi:hypothetical protein